MPRKTPQVQTWRGFSWLTLTSIPHMIRINIMNSSLSAIGQTLRSLRIAKGLTQEALASAAGISRTTLVQIEKGNGAHVSSVEGAAHVLGTTFGVLTESPVMACKRQARADHQLKLAASREKHLKLAVLFALDGAEALALKDNALHMVQRWEDNALCSPTYITRWRSILNAAPRQIAQSLMSMDDEWGPALRQNTPFAISAHPL